MKIIAINGSARRDWNTARMLESFLEGIKLAAPDADTRLIHLKDLNYSDCIECFGCKRIGPTYGHCVVRDDLHPIFPEISYADGLVLGSPIIFGEISGRLKSFVDRLLYQYHTYEEGFRSIAPKRFPVTMVYTMNVKPEYFEMMHYAQNLSNMENCIGHVFSQPNQVFAFNTYQFRDYSKYHAECFSEPEKARWREEELPKELKSAFDAGVDMITKIKESDGK